MSNNPDSGLSPAQSRDLRRLAGIMVPADAEYGVPGADDPAVFADIERSLGRDHAAVQQALAALNEMAGGSFADLDDARAEAAAETLLARADAMVHALGRAVLQCYYRDDRVFLSLGLEPRPPFPQGRTLEQGDWSLLDAVRAMPKLWRDAP